MQGRRQTSKSPQPVSRSPRDENEESKQFFTPPKSKSHKATTNKPSQYASDNQDCDDVSQNEQDQNEEAEAPFNPLVDKSVIESDYSSDEE